MKKETFVRMKRLVTVFSFFLLLFSVNSKATTPGFVFLRNAGGTGIIVGVVIAAAILLLIVFSLGSKSGQRK